MEEQRIGFMYLNLMKQSVLRLWDRLFARGLRRSPAFPVILFVVLILVPAFFWYLHTRGRFHALKSEIRGDAAEPAGPRPGGVDPIFLHAPQPASPDTPQFRSVTLLPGLGMDILQITAFLPGRGELPLLSAPSLEAIADGTAGPHEGYDDTRGALELPWAGGLTGIITPVGTTLMANWHGRTLEVPTDPQGRVGLALGGLLATQSADFAQQPAGPLGPSLVTAAFTTDFNGHWPSRTEIKISAGMPSQTILELTVTARNIGDQPEPMGIGWHPRFLLPSGHRDAAQLRLPPGEELEPLDRMKGTLTGRTIPPGIVLQHFQSHPSQIRGQNSGQNSGQIGVESIDETLTHLKPGTSAELLDPAAGFGLRLTAFSPSTQALRAASPAGSNWVSLGTQTNLDDPLGKEWSDDDGIATLLPGQSIEWRVRLEIFPLTAH